jgi:hypothetical protein
VDRRRIVIAGLVLSGAAEVWLAHRTALPGGILGRRYALLGEIAGWWLAFLAALACVWLLPRRTAVLLVLGLAVVLRLAAVSERAPLSDDLYRYAWDGVVQHDGIDPYRYAPRDPALVQLRHAEGSDWLWPRAWQDRERDSRLNRVNVHTIYPPAAEGWFAVLHAVVPLSAEDRGYEAVGLLVDLATLAVLLALLRSRGRDPRLVAVYALAPLPALEVVQNGHVDGLGVLLVLLAVWWWPRRPAWAAGALAAAALVKVYPGVLVALLLRKRDSRAKVLGVFVSVVVLAYLPHFLAVGTHLFGYIPGYLKEEQYDAGTRYLLVGLTGLTGAPATAVVGMLGATLLALLWRSSLSLELAGCWLFVGVLLLVTPVQPWYAVLLLALACASGSTRAVVAAVAVSAAAYPLFFATILDGRAVLVGRLSYGLALLVVLAALRWRQRLPAGIPG